MSRLITLTTDFGEADPFVGIMKGVILSIEPGATIVDLTHQIEPQNITQAAYVLKSALPYFPPHTIHVVVVDPGVGTRRRGLLVETPRFFLVGPDNGVLTPGLEPDAHVYHLFRNDYSKELSRIQPHHPPRSLSQTFHGRDVFAPVAAWLAHGTRPGALGERIDDPVKLNLPQPKFIDGILQGQIIYTDHFGNLLTNLAEPNISHHFPKAESLYLEIGGRRLTTFTRTYADATGDEPAFLINSWNVIEIFIKNGNARETLKTGVDTPVFLRTG